MAGLVAKGRDELHIAAALGLGELEEHGGASVRQRGATDALT
jgi:hypothetical protein